MNPLDFLDSQPWAIMPSALDQLRAFAESNPAIASDLFRTGEQGVSNWDSNVIKAVSAKMGRSLDGAKSVKVRDGVAEIPIKGVISRYSSFWEDYFGRTSTQALATDLQAAIDNPNVRSILLYFDSPGGQCFGLSELSGMIREANTKKPVEAFVGGYACSAAYWLASACRSVTMANTAIVGSIGTIASFCTGKPSGIVTLTSTQSPLKNPDMSTEAGQAALLVQLDAVSDVFIDAVAEYRDTPRAVVMEDFGRGGERVGQDAVDHGMADAVGTYEGTLARMAKNERLPVHTPKAKVVASVPKSESNKGASAKMFNPFAVLASMFAKDPASVSEAWEAVSTETTPQAQYLKLFQPAAQVKAEAATTTVLSTIPTRETIEAEIRATVEKENAEKQRTALAGIFGTQADAFLARMVKEEKITPAEVNAFKAEYVEAAMADTIGPLAFVGTDGKANEVKRVAVLSNRIEGKTSKGWTTELIPATDAKAPASLSGFSLLPNATSGDKDPAKIALQVKSILSMTDTGKAAALRLVQ